MSVVVICICFPMRDLSHLSLNEKQPHGNIARGMEGHRAPKAKYQKQLAAEVCIRKWPWRSGSKALRHQAHCLLAADLVLRQAESQLHLSLSHWPLDLVQLVVNMPLWWKPADGHSYEALIHKSLTVAPLESCSDPCKMGSLKAANGRRSRPETPKSVLHTHKR